MSTIQLIFFLSGFFFRDYSPITGLQGKEEGISLTFHNHFHLLYRHLDISQTISAGRSSLRVVRSWARAGNPWFPSASR